MNASECGHVFEVFQNMSDDALTDCPECKKPALRRLVSGGAGIIFRGSGFYVNDSRKTQDSGESAQKSDSAKSAKTGINYIGFKNMVGTIYPASELRICPALIESLPQREYLSGLAEVIKAAMLGDAVLLEFLEERHADIIHRDKDCLFEITRLLQLYGYRLNVDSIADEALLAAMKRDKKHMNGEVRFVLQHGQGETFQRTASDSSVLAALQYKV